LLGHAADLYFLIRPLFELILHFWGLGKFSHSPPEMNVDRCRLGCWMNTEGQSRYGSDPAFADIGRLHQKIHEIARDLCELAEGESRGNALARMGEVYDLRDRILNCLKTLLQ